MILHWYCTGTSITGLRAFAFWVLKYYRYKDIRLLNGGRKKWLQEDRPITKDIPHYPRGNYSILTDESSYEPDNSIKDISQ